MKLDFLCENLGNKIKVEMLYDNIWVGVLCFSEDLNCFYLEDCVNRENNATKMSIKLDERNYLKVCGIDNEVQDEENKKLL